MRNVARQPVVSSARASFALCLIDVARCTAFYWRGSSWRCRDLTRIPHRRSACRAVLCSWHRRPWWSMFRMLPSLRRNDLRGILCSLLPKRRSVLPVAVGCATGHCDQHGRRAQGVCGRRHHRSGYRSRGQDVGCRQDHAHRWCAAARVRCKERHTT